VPPLSAMRASQRLRAALLPQAALENPVDVDRHCGAEHFRAALQALLDDDAIDALLVNFVTPSFTDTQAIAREIVAASAQQRKPLVCNFMTDLTQERFRTTRAVLQEGGVPCFAYPSEAARALAALDRVARGCVSDAVQAAPAVFDDVDARRMRGASSTTLGPSAARSCPRRMSMRCWRAMASRWRRRRWWMDPRLPWWLRARSGSPWW
jgi:acyl-CoA synthetase (NDP forming)